MPKVVEANQNGVLEITRTVEDVDGDPLSIEAELDRVDGIPQTGDDRNPSWLSCVTSSALSGGTRTVEVRVQIDASEFDGVGRFYTLKLLADDGTETIDHTLTLHLN